MLGDCDRGEGDSRSYRYGIRGSDYGSLLCKYGIYDNDKVASAIALQPAFSEPPARSEGGVSATASRHDNIDSSTRAATETCQQQNHQGDNSPPPPTATVVGILPPSISTPSGPTQLDPAPTPYQRQDPSIPFVDHPVPGLRSKYVDGSEGGGYIPPPPPTR